MNGSLTVTVASMGRHERGEPGEQCYTELRSRCRPIQGDVGLNDRVHGQREKGRQTVVRLDEPDTRWWQCNRLRRSGADLHRPLLLGPTAFKTKMRFQSDSLLAQRVAPV
jgi:hypothetical protein